MAPMIFFHIFSNKKIVRYETIETHALAFLPFNISADGNGQLISKANCQGEDSSKKNELIDSYLLVCDVFSFVFWKNPQPEKNVSRLSDL